MQDKASLIQVVFHKPQPSSEISYQLSKCAASCNLAKILVVDRRSHPEYVKEKAVMGESESRKKNEPS
jgi:hypothetical protein